MAFAITGGTFNNPAIWDTGIVPTGSEDAYSNGYTIQISGTVNCGAVRNDASDYRFIDTAIPLMTSNISPSGIVTADRQRAGGEPFRAFDRNSGTAWGTPDFISTGIITYNFISTRTIKRYMFRVLGTAQAPRNWTFQASNDVNFGAGNVATLDTQTNANFAAGGVYTSGLINTGNIAYQYYRINVTAVGSTWPLQIAEIEMTENVTTSVGQILGGTFNLTNGSTLNCSAPTGVVVGSTTAPITFALAGGNSATVNATIPTLTTTAEFRAVLLNGLGTLNFNGDISCGPTSTTNKRVIHITAAGTLNYSGVCTNGGNTSGQCNSIFSAAAANVNILTTGFAGGSNTSNANASVFLNAGGNLTIIGPITGGNSPAVVMVGGSLTVSGSVVGTSSAAITNLTTVTPIDINGTVTAGNGSPAITGLGAVTIPGPLINTNGFMAVSSPSIFITSATTYWSFTSSGGSPRILYTDAPTNTTGFPSSTDVRKDIVYGPTNTTIGTMNVPLPSDVRINVPTDNTVGTATLTAQDLFDAITSSTSGVGLRLKNVATVATVGKQIASFNI